MEYSIKPKRLGERGIIHYPQKRIIGLYVRIRRAEYQNRAESRTEYSTIMSMMPLGIP